MTWQLGPEDLPDLARGAALLGTGGGGDPVIEPAPPASTISVRQVTSGSRLTSVAARSEESSAARNHSSSAILTAISGRPAKIGSRVAPESPMRIISAVR